MTERRKIFEPRVLSFLTTSENSSHFGTTEKERSFEAFDLLVLRSHTTSSTLFILIFAYVLYFYTSSSFLSFELHWSNQIFQSIQFVRNKYILKNHDTKSELTNGSDPKSTRKLNFSISIFFFRDFASYSISSKVEEDCSWKFHCWWDGTLNIWERGTIAMKTKYCMQDARFSR